MQDKAGNKGNEPTAAETCTGQCGYSDRCRRCEQEKQRTLWERERNLAREGAPHAGVQVLERAVDAEM